MAQRTSLQALLEGLLGSRNVYFQPPPSIQMQYPAIIYRRDDDSVDHAGNKPYSRRIRYEVMVIDANPDSLIPEKIAGLPLCRFDRFYTAQKLNHDVFKLFF
jgi:hypothetical protein